VARSIFKVLTAARLNCFLKTSGATGFHIYVPLKPQYTYEQARTFAQIIGQIVASELPNDTTVERTVSKRPKGRVLLDALQNARGKPLAAVYSVRAHPGATVSTPVNPEELQQIIDPEKWTLKTLEKRLAEAGDLWEDFWDKRQALDRALEALSGRFSTTASRRRGSTA
jgi:bifunctional non-homologous end joining protein LigD